MQQIGRARRPLGQARSGMDHRSITTTLAGPTASRRTSTKAAMRAAIGQSHFSNTGQHGRFPRPLPPAVPLIRITASMALTQVIRLTFMWQLLAPNRLTAIQAR